MLSGMTILFKDRAQAAAMLSLKLKWLAAKKTPQWERRDVTQENNGVIIMGIPRGGMITADIIAYNLQRKLDVILSTKFAARFNSELDVGAVAPDGSFFPNTKVIKMLNVLQSYIDEQISVELKKIQKRLLKFRGTSRYQIDEKIVVLVDDGICTGLTMRAVAQWARAQNTRKLIIAVPFAPRDMIVRLEKMADTVIALYTPLECEAVGEFYQYFPEVTDKQVYDIMRRYRSLDNKNYKKDLV